MINDELQDKLQRNRDLSWTVGLRHEVLQNETITIKWLPVMDVPKGRMRIGLSEVGLWVIATAKSVAEFKPGSPAIFLLPVLEMQIADLKRTLTDGLRTNGLCADLAAKFPFEAVVTTALKSNSEYWIRLALDWIPQLQMTPMIREALQEVAQIGPTQAIRQSAKQAR